MVSHLSFRLIPSAHLANVRETGREITQISLGRVVYSSTVHDGTKSAVYWLLYNSLQLRFHSDDDFSIKMSSDSVSAKLYSDLQVVFGSVLINR